MKRLLPVITLCILIILSAGCISFGQQTTDIMLGGEKIGTITLSPNSDGTVNADITVFGMTFTKENLTVSEAETLTESASSGNLLEGIGITGIPENAGVADDLGEFAESILNMPLTNSGEGGAALNFTLAAENAGNTVEALETIIRDTFGI